MVRVLQGVLPAEFDIFEVDNTMRRESEPNTSPPKTKREDEGETKVDPERGEVYRVARDIRDGGSEGHVLVMLTHSETY